jgi:hypothetical protein
MIRTLTLATTLVLGLATAALSAEPQPRAPASAAGKPAGVDAAGKAAPPAAGTQTAPARPEAHHHEPGKPASPAEGMMGKGMGMCPMMIGGDTKMAVKNLPDGVTITLTSANAETVARLRKAAEHMRSMHE